MGTVRTVGAKQSLPPVHALAGLEENDSTSGLDEQQQVERGLADCWTHEGLLLGILLSNRNLCHRTTMCVKVLCVWWFVGLFFLYVQTPIDMDLVLVFGYSIVIACCGYAFLFVWWAFYEYVDKPRVTLANRVIADQFSELTRPRHGYRVNYELRPSKVGARRCMGWTHGAIQYVKEEQVWILMLET